MKPSEFFRRWGEGINKITPLQLTFQQLIGQIIVLLGICIGLVVTFKYKQWWLFIILVGSLIVAGTGLLGAIQKYSILKQFSVPASVNISSNKNTKEVIPKYV